jgi:hypothetical protein
MDYLTYYITSLHPNNQLSDVHACEQGLQVLSAHPTVADCFENEWWQHTEAATVRTARLFVL